MFILEDIESPKNRKGMGFLGAKQLSEFPEEMVQAFKKVPPGSNKNL